jgi:hypothetical protein
MRWEYRVRAYGGLVGEAKRFKIIHDARERQ